MCGSKNLPITNYIALIKSWYLAKNARIHHPMIMKFAFDLSLKKIVAKYLYNFMKHNHHYKLIYV